MGKLANERVELAGKKCLIMRDVSQAQSLINGVQSLGGIPILVPLISFRKSVLSDREQKQLKNLSDFDWLVFTSQNGVRFFLEQLAEYQLMFPEHVKVAVVGSKTKNSLLENGITPDFIPKKFTGEILAEEMKEFIKPGDKICIIKGNLARDRVSEVLKQSGAFVTDIVIYETFLPDESKEKLIEALQNHVDILIFTSPSTVEHFMDVLKMRKAETLLNGKWIACIGPVTKKALLKYNLPIHVCPEIYTIEHLLEGLKQFFNNTNPLEGEQ